MELGKAIGGNKLEQTMAEQAMVEQAMVETSWSKRWWSAAVNDLKWLEQAIGGNWWGKRSCTDGLVGLGKAIGGNKLVQTIGGNTLEQAMVGGRGWLGKAMVRVRTAVDKRWWEKWVGWFSVCRVGWAKRAWE